MYPDDGRYRVWSAGGYAWGAQIEEREPGLFHVEVSGWRGVQHTLPTLYDAKTFATWWILLNHGGRLFRRKKWAPPLYETYGRKDATEDA
jgi:hypothetical protein